MQLVYHKKLKHVKKKQSSATSCWYSKNKSLMRTFFYDKWCIHTQVFTKLYITTSSDASYLLMYINDVKPYWGLWMKYTESDILWHWVTAYLNYIFIIPVTECVGINNNLVSVCISNFSCYVTMHMYAIFS